MTGDFLLREQFITAPSQLIADYLGGEKLTDEAAGANDQLIYAVFSDEKLLRALREKLSHGPDLVDDQESFAGTLATAIAETGARPAVTALMRASIARQDVLARNGALAQLLKSIDIAGGVALTEASGGTMMTTGHSTGTMVSTAHRIAQTEMSTGHSTGTEMSTGHSMLTEMSTGHSTGTEMSTGHSMLTEMSTGHSTGTEMSTGHSMLTEMSTGHSTGTEMSTGHSFGEIFAQGPFRATLLALSDYALTLKRQGALDSVVIH